jgi:hypothetical protein
MPAAGSQPGWFPRSLWLARRRRSPALSQRPRHACAAGIQRGLPDRQPCLPGVPAAHEHSGTRRARPVSARFEPVSWFKDVTTPVPRVLLSATLAGPAPSGSTRTSRLCQGCSRPPRHHPDQAALSFTSLLRQASGEGLSPPLEPTAPRGALRGHEKVPVCGQVEVLAGGQLKVPIPRSSCRPGV